MGLFTEHVAAGVGRWPPTVVSGLAIMPLVLIAFNKRRPQLPSARWLFGGRQIEKVADTATSSAAVD